MASGGATACAIICAVLLLIGTILLACSFGTISPLQFGIRYNGVTRKIDESGPWFSGRYFVGLGSKFIKYPSTWNLMVFEESEIKAWTHEGQQIEISMAMYWEFDRSRIVEFYYNYGNKEEDYIDVLKDIALRAVKKVCANYNATEFFSDRDLISRDANVALRAAFLEQGLVVQIASFLSFDLPDEFEAMIVSKVVMEQRVITEGWIAKINVSNAQIEVIKGEGDALVQLLTANANADASLVVSNAFADGQKRVQDAEAVNYQRIQTALAMSPDELLKLRVAKLPQDLETSNPNIDFTFGYSAPIITV